MWMTETQLRTSKGYACDGGLYQTPEGKSPGGGGEYTRYFAGDREVHISSHLVWKDTDNHFSATPIAWATDASGRMVCRNESGNLFVVGLSQGEEVGDYRPKGCFIILDEEVPAEFLTPIGA